jgi:dienelactone hydrolase
MERLSLLLVTLLTFLGAGDSSAAVVIREGVQYGQGRVQAPETGQAPLLLDLYRPAKRARRARPVVILIHGGGFAHGDRADPRIVRIARALAGRGIVAVSIDYRLMGRRPVPSDRVAPLLGGLPDGDFSRAVVAAVDDTLSAIRFLRRHAKRYGIDPARIGLVGSSAGAITADHVAYVLDDHGITGPRIRFVGSLWGGILIASRQERKNGASQLDRREAALFAVHGVRDYRLPVVLSDRLIARAVAQRVPNEYHRIPRGGHGYEAVGFFTSLVSGEDTAFDRLLDFARSRLRQRR